MTDRVRRRDAARRDLVEIYRYLAREAGLLTAARFLSETEKTLKSLVRTPGLGARFPFDHPRLAEIRYLPVSRFRNHLIFYRPTSEGIELVRLLHGARDIPTLLAAEFGIAPPEEEEGTANDDT